MADRRSRTEPTVALFLQARLDSSRLPRKALLPLAGKTVIEQVLAALNRINADSRWLLTCSDSARELAPPAEAAGFRLFVGPKEDVLRRFVLAARQCDAAVIMRATGDNPLVSYEWANRLLTLASGHGADYAIIDGLPTGGGVELIGRDALMQIDKLAEQPYQREHVTPYIYQNRADFSICRYRLPVKWRLSGARTTLDTQDDYQKLMRIFADCYEGYPISYRRLYDWWKKESWQ